MRMRVVFAAGAATLSMGILGVGTTAHAATSPKQLSDTILFSGTAAQGTTGAYQFNWTSCAWSAVGFTPMYGCSATGKAVLGSPIKGKAAVTMTPAGDDTGVKFSFSLTPVSGRPNTYAMKGSGTETENSMPTPTTNPVTVNGTWSIVLGSPISVGGVVNVLEAQGTN